MCCRVLGETEGGMRGGNDQDTLYSSIKISNNSKCIFKASREMYANGT